MPAIKFKSLSNPILILNDAPEQLSGLARIGRDLAGLLCTMPEFRVAYLGRGGMGRRKFAWTSYEYPVSGQWGEGYIAHAWNDFSGGEPGIIWSLWDLSRMMWFTHPQGLPDDLVKFLGPGRNFRKWAYTPIDSTGPDEQSLPAAMAATARGYDRLLAPSEWGANVLRRTAPADWIPHGIWTGMFHPRPKSDRALLGWEDDSVIVGCNMANQARKDWPVAFECAAILKQEFGNKFKFWAHTNAMVHYWSIYALAADYGLNDCLEVSLDLTDEQLSLRYALCDATMLPSAGEGFGYPIAESMACGTACVVTDYAAGQELVDEHWKVPAVAFRIDSLHNVRRAVLSGWGFASRVQHQIERKRGDWDYRGAEIRERVAHLDWDKLKHVWTKWLREGLR